MDPWHEGVPPADVPLVQLLEGSAEQVARRLLGARLISEFDGERTVGVIVETEAYLGVDDPASHAAARVGRTRRNASMFGPAGQAYVYLIYGMHWCMNVVTGGAGNPSAVLLRALDPIEGCEIMSRRRHGRREIASGPGRLGQAMRIDGSCNRRDLSRPPLTVAGGWPVADATVGVSPRIGVTRADDWPLRFYVRGNAHVSGKPR